MYLLDENRGANLVGREYLRVSRDRWGTGKSPDEQHAENAKAVERWGWTLHDRPYRDDDRSASRYATKQREDFEQLLDDLRADRFDAQVLVLWESSRGSRDVGEWVGLIELLVRRGILILVVSHSHVYDPSQPRDRRSLLEDAVDAEYESAKTSQRLQRSARAAAEAGRVHGKNLYGYRRVYDEQTRQLVRIEPHPEQAPVVRLAVEMYLAGATFGQVAKELNLRGIPVRRPKQLKTPGKNVAWRASSTKQLLENRAYCGVRLHHGEVTADAAWPALISEDEWDRMREIQATRAKAFPARSGDSTARRLLTGIAQCDECGSWMKMGLQNLGRPQYDDHGRKLPQQKYETYICGQRMPGIRGSHVTMRRNHLDHAMSELVIARLSRPDFLDAAGDADDRNRAERERLRAEIASHQAWIEEVRERAERTHNLDLLFDQESRVAPKIREAQQRLEQLSAVDPAAKQLAGADSVRAAWERMSIHDRRKIVRTLAWIRIKRVQPSDRGHRGVNLGRIVIEWKQ